MSRSPNCATSALRESHGSKQVKEPRLPPLPLARSSSLNLASPALVGRRARGSRLLCSSPPAEQFAALVPFRPGCLLWSAGSTDLRPVKEAKLSSFNHHRNLPVPLPWAMHNPGYTLRASLPVRLTKDHHTRLAWTERTLAMLLASHIQHPPSSACKSSFPSPFSATTQSCARLPSLRTTRSNSSRMILGRGRPDT